MISLLHKIWLILTLDCEQSAKLTSDSLDRPLDWSERWAVRLHCLVCGKSRVLDRQIIQLGKACESAQSQQPNLSPEGRDRIREKLREAAVANGDSDDPAE